MFEKRKKQTDLTIIQDTVRVEIVNIASCKSEDVYEEVLLEIANGGRFDADQPITLLITSFIDNIISVESKTTLIQLAEKLANKTCIDE